MAAFSATRKKPISRLDSMTLRSQRNLEAQTLAEYSGLHPDARAPRSRRVDSQRAHFLVMNATAEERRASGDGEGMGDEDGHHHLHPARTRAAATADEEHDHREESGDARRPDEEARRQV